MTLTEEAFPRVYHDLQGGSVKHQALHLPGGIHVKVMCTL